MVCRLLVACLCGLGLVGCAVPELRNDQDRIRCTLLSLYTNQTLDNLVRAHNGLPIIQLDYTNANASVTVSENASLSNTLITTRTNALTVALAKAEGITRTTLDTVMGGLGAAQTNLIAVTANPVLTSHELYDAYLAFLGLPGSLCQGPDPPPEGVAHVCRKYGKVYYWVPVEYREQFFNLATITTVQRGRVLLPPDPFYTVTLLSIEGEPRPTPYGFRAIVRLDKEVPNDTGHLEFPDGTRLNFHEYNPPDKSLRLFVTDRLRLEIDTSEAPLGIKGAEDLRSRLPLTVKMRLDHNEPAPPTTRELLDRIPFRAPQTLFSPARLGAPE
jgi:hypothetical protein